MGNSIFNYVMQLEMLAFFSGYPLVYFLAPFLARNVSLKNSARLDLVSILPYAYALIGTLYLGLQLKNLYPDYTVANIKHRIQLPYLFIWALLSILFWIPAISKRLILSVLHSLVFFFIIIKDLFFQLAGVTRDSNIIKNDMRIYSVSILLNMAALIFLVLISYLHRYLKKYAKS